MLLEHGDGVVDIKEVKDADGKPDLLMTVDKEKINTSGKKAIGDFLRKLQVRPAARSRCSRVPPGLTRRLFRWRGAEPDPSLRGL